MGMSPLPNESRHSGTDQMIQPEPARVCMSGQQHSNPHNERMETAAREANDAVLNFGRFSHSLTGTTTYNLNIIYGSVVVVRKRQYNLNTTSA